MILGRKRKATTEDDDGYEKKRPKLSDVKDPRAREVIVRGQRVYRAAVACCHAFPDVNGSIAYFNESWQQSCDYYDYYPDAIPFYRKLV